MTTIPRRASASAQTAAYRRTTTQASAAPDDEWYGQHHSIVPRSALRYPQPDTEDDVFTVGNRRIVPHKRPPAPPPKPKRRVHWLFLVGVGMIVTIALFWAGVAVVNAYSNWQLDSTYEYPRIYQTTAVVGHGDSAAHPSYFQCVNYQGQPRVIEWPAGDASKAKIYLIDVAIMSSDPASVPCTLSFSDVSGDGRPDMLVHIGTQTLVFINTGSQFVPQH